MIKVKNEQRFIEMRALDNEDGKMIIEGYAITYDQPATHVYGNRKFTEVIKRGALDDTDMEDVPLRYNHNDTWCIMARTRNKSLQLIKDERGLKIVAELIDTQSNRDIYKSIREGLIDKMSFAFTVSDMGDKWEYGDEETVREVTAIRKLYDVSVVDTPFYDTTSVYSRSFELMDNNIEKCTSSLKIKGSERNMKLEELLKNEKEKRDSLYEKIKFSESIEEIRGIQVEIAKSETEIKKLKETIEERNKIEEDPAARDDNSYNDNPEQRAFNPLATYSYRNSHSNISSNDELGTIALRSKDKLIDILKLTSEERNLDIGKYIRGVVTGNWDGAESEKRALTTTATGVMIPAVLSAQIIDYARNLSLFSSADVPIIPMDSNNITISRIKSDPTFKFKEEGKEIKESSLELESVEMKSKTCYGYAYVSLEAIQSSKNLSQTIVNTFSSAIASAIDKGMLYGQYNGSSYDDFAPKGIINDMDINSIEFTTSEGYDAFIKAIGKIKRANGIPSTYCMNADTEEMLDLLKDSNGKYLEKPNSVNELRKIVTNQLNSDEAKGNDALVFDSNSMIIGMQKNINIEMFTNTDECIKKGLVGFRIYSMVDCVVTQPKKICKITGIE